MKQFMIWKLFLMLKDMDKNKILSSLSRFDLTGQVCLVTGGAGLIGSAFSRVLASSGATVVIVDMDEIHGAAVAHEINQDIREGAAYYQKCDITSEKDIQKLLDEVLERFEHIDALVNNAFPRNKNWGKLFEDVTYADFCEHLDMHIGGYFLMTKEVAIIMETQKRGAIVNLSSIYGVVAPKFSIYEGAVYSVDDKSKPMTTPVEYSAIKGAVVNLTKYWASYLGQYNIRVNAISPGGVFDHQPDSFVQKYSERVPLGKRMANVEDLTGVLVFLLSDAARYMTGQNIIVDGGWTL